jgi:hypothetical protein
LKKVRYALCGEGSIVAWRALRCADATSGHAIAMPQPTGFSLGAFIGTLDFNAIFPFFDPQNLSGTAIDDCSHHFPRVISLQIYFP